LKKNKHRHTHTNMIKNRGRQHENRKARQRDVKEGPPSAKIDAQMHDKFKDT